MGSAVVKPCGTGQADPYNKYPNKDRKSTRKQIAQNRRYPTKKTTNNTKNINNMNNMDGVSDSSGSPTSSSQYRCGGPSILEGTITPALTRADQTVAYWRRVQKDVGPEPVVLLYQIVVRRPSHDVWAFYNDTEDIHFLVTYHFPAHPLQTREVLRPLGATTLVWQPDGGAVAKLSVGPTETSLALMGHLIAYRITIEGIPRDSV